MARVTVEDCLKQQPNQFKLVLQATQRARQLMDGAEPTVPWNRDKPTVIALREIAQQTFTEQKKNSDSEAKNTDQK